MELYDVEFEDDMWNFKMKLKNFWLTKKSIKFVYISGESNLELSHHVNRDNLTLKLPLEYIHCADNSKIQMLSDGKNLVITPNRNLRGWMGRILKSKFFVISAHKNIRIKKILDDVSFKEEVTVENIFINYEEMILSLENKDIGNLKEEDVSVLAISGNAKRTFFPRVVDRNKLVCPEMDYLSQGKWVLFLSIKDVNFPLVIDNIPTQGFDTYKHKVQVNKLDTNELVLHVARQKIKIDHIGLNHNGEKVTLAIESNQFVEDGNYQLIMNDTRSTDFYYSLRYTAEGLECDIPISDLLHNYTRKRFFILLDDEQPIIYQFLLKKRHRTYLIDQKLVYDSQNVIYDFYIRKDKSLGIKILKPKVEKVINNIKELNVSGYVNNLSNFIDCNLFLYVEERNSKDYIKVPIMENFSVDLGKYNLPSLKSKDKTIFDFYIVIENKDHGIVRKEKIKYKYSDYKKDNYYEHVVKVDEYSNNHHFLFTTTPFNNLKIETFIIPHYIDIPDDTSFKDDNIWLIGERYNTAQDNGFVLFQWLQKNTDIDVYYVIESSADDYVRIKHLPNVLEFGSDKHYQVAFKAKVLLCTHDLENILPYKPAKGFFHYENTFKVFLQHGVLGRKNVEYHKRYYEIPFDLFVVSSEPEKREVVMEEMGYNEEDVVVTGLARFDNLIQKDKPKNILLMPTWRDWINTDEQFLNSQYYKRYLSLINSDELMELLDFYNVNLNFYPHYRAQEYFQKGSELTSDRVNFITLGSKTVQELLIEHALLITDYSSVSFDFTLMNKPVIYYHFDVKRFFRRGILRPVEETFLGEIAFSESELIKLIEERLSLNLKNYKIDVSGVFKYQDSDNCKRIYDKIITSLHEC